MRSSSKSRSWAVAVLLCGTAALASVAACGSSGSSDRNPATTATAGSGNGSSGAGNSTAGAGVGVGGGVFNTAGGAAGGGSTSTKCPMKCACPYPAGDGTMNVIANAEDGKSMFKTAGVTTASGYWDLSGDGTGTLTPMNTAMLLPVAGGANNTMKAFNIKGDMHTKWGAALAAEVNNGCPFNASKYGGFSFYAKGTSTVIEGANKLLIAVGMPEFIPTTSGGFCDEVAKDPLCYARHRVTIDLTAEWKQYIIAWEDLQAPAYLNGAGPMFGADRIRDIVFNASGPSGDATMAAASFDFWVDELQFVPTGTKGNLGGMGMASAGASSGGAASAAGAGGASAGAGGAAAGTGGA